MQRLLPEKAATVFISTGELSGEMHAAQLVRALQRERAAHGLPPALIEGNGSAAMAQAGVRLLFDVATWSELGIVANLLKAQHFHRVSSNTARYILGNQPDMVILVDNRVLNLSLARYLRRQGYSGMIVYYVAPVRWESLYKAGEHAKSLRNARFIDVKRFCDYAVPIYPVSLQVYDELEIPHGFFGHPLCELAQPTLSDAEFYSRLGMDAAGSGAAAAPFIIGVMPGSRRGEIHEIAEVMFSALTLIAQSFRATDGAQLKIVAPLAHAELRPALLAAAQRAGLGELVLIPPELTYDLMARARVMLVKSGTGLHQCVLMDVPAVMCYRVAPSVALLLRLMRFSMPFYGLPNLLAGRQIVPELVQGDCTEQKIAAAVRRLLNDASAGAAMRGGYAEVRALLCRPEPLKCIAEAVQSLLQR